MWYLLADANGLAPNQPLIANTVLTVPNKVTNIHNNASTFKPYDAGEAMGNTSPTVPDPPPPPAAKKGCGGFVRILAVVVAIVVTAYLGPIAGQAVGSWIVGGAIAGAAGAVASQAVLIAGGEQKGFDWKGVALGAVAGAVTAGLTSPGVGNALTKAGITSAWGQATVRGAIGSVVNQGAAVALGVQDEFDWEDVAISAVSASAGTWAGGKVANYGERSGWSANTIQNVSRFASGVTAGTVSAAARGNLSSQVLTSVGLDAIASTIGAGIAERRAGTGSFAKRYPSAQASAANGDVQVPGDIDVGRMNAFLRSPGASDAVTLERVTATYDRSMYDIDRQTFPIPTSDLWYDGSNVFRRESDGALRYPMHSNGVEFAAVIAATTAATSDYGVRALRGDVSLAWDVAADTLNSYGRRFAGWYSATALGQSGAGQRMLGQTRPIPRWNLDGIRRAVLPTVAEWGDRGTSGNIFQYWTGRAKWTGNFASDIGQIGVDISPAWGLPRYIATGGAGLQLPHFEYSSQELFGAAELEFAAAALPEFGAFKRVERIGGRRLPDASENISGAAFRHATKWAKNPDGARTVSEALELAENYGVYIADDVRVRFVPDERYESMFGKYGDSFASYGHLGDANLSSLLTWKSIARFDGNVEIFVRQSVLDSDESIVAVLHHETFEVEELRREFMRRGGMTAGEYKRLTADNVVDNIHFRAVDVGDQAVWQLRRDRSGL